MSRSGVVLSRGRVVLGGVMLGVSGGNRHGSRGVHGSDGGSNNNLGGDQVAVGRVRNGRVRRHFCCCTACFL